MSDHTCEFRPPTTYMREGYVNGEKVAVVPFLANYGGSEWDDNIIWRRESETEIVARPQCRWSTYGTRITDCGHQEYGYYRCGALGPVIARIAIVQEPMETLVEYGGKAREVHV